MYAYLLTTAILAKPISLAQADLVHGLSAASAGALAAGGPGHPPPRRRKGTPYTIPPRILDAAAGTRAAMVLRRCPPSPVAQAAQLGDRVGYIRSCTSTDVHVDIYRLTDACKCIL